MKLKYKAPKGQRCNYAYCGVTTFDGYMYTEVENNKFKWVNNENVCDYEYSVCTHAPCRNIKQFKRLLKKWRKYLPKGIKFILISRYVNNDVEGKI
jgi:hypothetical protein